MSIGNETSSAITQGDITAATFLGKILVNIFSNGALNNIRPRYTEYESKNPTLNSSDGVIAKTISALIDKLVVLSGLSPSKKANSLSEIITNALIDDDENPQNPT